MPTARTHPPTREDQIRERLAAYRKSRDSNDPILRGEAEGSLLSHAADDLEHLLTALDELAMVARVALAVGDARRAVARGRHGDAARIIRTAMERGTPVALTVAALSSVNVL